MVDWDWINWHDLDRGDAALAMNMPKKRFFRSEVELMGFYHRGSAAPRPGRYYLSVDRAGDPVVVKPWEPGNPYRVYDIGVSVRFRECWRPWQVKDGLWFWGVA